MGGYSSRAVGTVHMLPAPRAAYARRSVLRVGGRGTWTHEMPARLAAWWIALAALWLALDDTVALPELLTGAAAALLGAIAAEVVHSQKLVRVRLQPSWLRHAWRPV